MKEYVCFILYKILTVLNSFIPKKKKIMIYAGKMLRDNNEAIFSYLLENYKYPIVCIADITMNYKTMPNNIHFKKNTYRNAIYEILTSKVMIDESLHTIKVKPKKGQVFIQLWHGSPFKLITSKGLINRGEYYTHFFYASELFKKVFCEYYRVEEKKLILNGNPRNKYLFDKKNRGDDIESKKVIWMPTYRQGLGKSVTSDSIPIIDDKNIGILNNILREKNIVLYIKPHPLQTVSLDKIFKKTDYCNISLITDADLFLRNIPLYRFLGEMDALITDYSSVFFDYLLLDRPIGFAIGDIDEYNANVGFIVDNPVDYMPGPKIYSYEDLVQFFDDLEKDNDVYSSERNRIRNLSNYYQDINDCERVANLIKKAMDD